MNFKNKATVLYKYTEFRIIAFKLKRTIAVLVIVSFLPEKEKGRICMTLHAVYRFNDDRAIFVSDFRVTETARSSQSDISFKFTSDDDKVGLFLSGDVDLWKIILEGFGEIASHITLENAMDVDGVFNQYLIDCALRNPHYSAARAIGFVIDHEKKENVLFQIEISPGLGANIKPIEKNTCELIGAGPIIPNLYIKITQRIQRDVEFFGMDLYQLADGMRKEIINTLISCGANAFSKFGVSPVMFISSLAGSHFIIRGEEINYGRYTDDSSPVTAKYAFTTNVQGQKVLLEYNDESKSREVPLQDIHQIVGNNTQNTFDPEKHEQLFDPTEEFSDRSFIHLLHQWVIPAYLGTDVNTVYRSIKKIEIIEVGPRNKRFKIMKPLEILSYIIKVSNEKLALYPDSRDNYILIDESFEKEFEDYLTPNRLFNHKFLGKYISDYEKILYKGNLE